MSHVTAASMRDARDVEDKRLLDEGRIDELLAGWVETIRGRCVSRMRGPVGLDVAQAVCLRLWRELKSGKHRDGVVPFRVVVHKVIGWACDGWYEQGWGEVALVELDGPEPDPTDSVVVNLTLEQFVETLPSGDGEVARLLWLEKPPLEPGQIAARLAREPNAVYQSIHRNKAKLREWLEA
jgi:DNA-directed RNA polymerase specialized sigma24 family protein